MIVRVARVRLTYNRSFDIEICERTYPRKYFCQLSVKILLPVHTLPHKKNFKCGNTGRNTLRRLTVPLSEVFKVLHLKPSVDIMQQLGGLIITALGSIVLYMKQKTIRDAFDFFLDPAMLMVTAGSIIVFITFFGCMGSLRENTCFLKTFNYILGIIFLGELTIVVIVFVFYFVPDSRESLGLFPKDSMQDAIRKYGVVDDEDMVNLIDNIQSTLGCCGLSDDEDGYLDWNENLYFNCTKSNPSPERCSVPASCCITKPNEVKNILCGGQVMQINDEGKAVAGPYISNIYQPGCLHALGNWINGNAMVLGGVLLGILLPQLFIMCLTRSLRDQVKIQRAKWDRQLPVYNDDKGRKNRGYSENEK
ncbi:hypothetical protein FSP39_001763 [Pinctada imbricata]|uniref:Tetraspanin n=1 Tax=Pinctada imbricata TaxID=66713 RepID=A0AA88XYE5_PINIB|nr:hypothetical protein FSP39_001763 [Pinctada imbricata]